MAQGARVPGCSGKVKYGTRALAEAVVGNQAGRQWMYECAACGCWHTSRQSPEEFERRKAAWVERRRRYVR
ncbi:MAG TPA: hypothetical protein VLZ78_06140 [Terrimesophilobacter sp.]|nr:hypothetical protein [Terrimesophilobacter sp.]